MSGRGSGVEDRARERSLINLKPGVAEEGGGMEEAIVEADVSMGEFFFPDKLPKLVHIMAFTR